MKTHRVELQRIKAIGASHGMLSLRVDALVEPLPARDAGEPSSLVTVSVENARVLLLLLKQQLAELEPRKGKSQR